MEVPLLRIVLDTNVYISAVLHGRVAETILELASGRLVTLLTSEILLVELEDKLKNKLVWSADQVDFYLELIRDIAEIVVVSSNLDVVPDDADDNRVVACAVDGHADLIVTFHKDLLRLKSYQMIGIITPRQLTFYGLNSV
jgi:putative PIN family toxin of toxin-antitoxin system